MAATPARGVHWDPKNLSPSFLHSPAFEGSTESYISTSSLEYVNAQLVAHGFVPSSGLSLDGLSGTDSDRVVKCLLGMLSQRVGDMSRMEELSTKFRTLTYDHERLLTMHRVAIEKSANAEREANLHKAKLTATQRQLQSAEHAHKQTSSELQRTRTALQGIRSTHVQELKKKEKELERITDKWNRISDLQTKLSTIPSGIKCSNAAIVDGSELLPRTPSLLDTALDDAERAREQFADEVARLRRLVVKVVNQVQAVLYQVRGYMSDSKDDPITYTLTNLFPMHPQTHAHDTLCSILNALKDSLAALPQHIASSPASAQSTTSTSSTSQPAEKPNPEETARLQATIAQLKEEIEHLNEQAHLQTTKTQALFDNFIASQQKTSANIAEMSMELMTAPTADAERERLDKIKQELDIEREKFTRAAVKLGQERAALETDRTKLLDEKRSWQVQQILADLPPTPDPHPPAQVQPKPRAQLHKSPRKPKQIHQSPSKKSPRKPHHKRQSSSSSSSASRKATRVFRRPSDKPAISTAITATIPAYETELIVTAPDEGELQQEMLYQAPPPIAAPSFSLKPPTSILPSSFVLPPPSPHASLPRKALLPPSSSSTHQPPIPQPDFLMTHLPPPLPNEESTPFPQSHQPRSAPPHSSTDQVEGQKQLLGTDFMTTPIKRRPFPMAKPFAQKMVHAYSPAKPSPLSRILLLNSNSPDTPFSPSNDSTIDAARLGVVREEEYASVEAIEDLPDDIFPELPPETPQHQQGQQRTSLAAELGVESPPEVIVVEEVEVPPPLKERKTGEMNGRSTTAATTRGANGNKPTTSAKGVSAAGSGAGTRKSSSTGLGVTGVAGAKERPKSRNSSETASGKSSNSAGGKTSSVEKENGATSRTTKPGVKKTSSGGATASSTARAASTGIGTRGAAGSKPTSTKSNGATTTAAAAATKIKISASSKPGADTMPRRVPKNSAEAPDIIRRKP